MSQARDNAALVLDPELFEAVHRVISAAQSGNTRRAYATQFAKFEAWCARRCTSALPATPAVVAINLTELAATGADPGKPAKGAKVATFGLAFSAISAAHRTAGLGLDTKARELKEAVKGIRKKFATLRRRPSRSSRPWSGISCHRLMAVTLQSIVATRR